MDINALQSFRLAPVEHKYDFKESILYALGLGFGERPTDPHHLQFVYEKGLKAVPSACNVLAHPGFWVKRPELKLDWVKLLHGEQSFQMLRTLPPEGCVRGEYEIAAVEDKGAQRGAVMHVNKRLYDAAGGELIANVASVYLLRGDGAQGSFGTAPPPPEALPEGRPDLTVDIKTLPQSALIYRLSGDFNPIHVDPTLAARAGFAQPILHGMCSMGLASRGLIESVCEGDPQRLRSLSVRFSKPVYPGETLRLEIFKSATGVRFRARIVERDAVVLDRGSAEC